MKFKSVKRNIYNSKKQGITIIVDYEKKEIDCRKPLIVHIANYVRIFYSYINMITLRSFLLNCNKNIIPTHNC